MKAFFFFPIPAVAALVVTLFLYRRRFLGMGWGALLWFGAWVCAAAVTADRFGLFTGHTHQLVKQDRLHWVLSGLCAGLLIVFAVPFAVRLYGKWIGSSIDEQEKASGVEGVRAWLKGWNVLLAVAISLCAWQGFQYSFWGVLAMTMGLLLAYPAVKALSAAGQSPQAAAIPAADPAADLSDERERVLKLLEDGKVTAEEGAELLSALSETARPELHAPTAMTPGRKLLLLGALLVIVGFFLPWYSIDISQEMARAGHMMSDPGNQMSRSVGAPQMPSAGMPMQAAFSGTVRVAGGEVAHGFGWIVLLLAVLAAALPFVKLDVSRQTQRILLVAPLAVGAFIIVYLLTRDIRQVSFGLPLVLAGYAAEFIGLMKDIPSGA